MSTRGTISIPEFMASHNPFEARRMYTKARPSSGHDDACDRVLPSYEMSYALEPKIGKFKGARSTYCQLSRALTSAEEISKRMEIVDAYSGSSSICQCDQILPE
ncbi:hypothetical protein BC835DRAFT_1311578 [Cytidiella melzeri]|nr:hypothetical protein BC835DRAFT_1311578 [Cytidiella melzeri]